MDAYHDLMADVIYERDRIQDYGFIDLSTKFVPAHIATDPRNNDIKVEVPDKYKIVLKAGKSLKDILDIIE